MGTDAASVGAQASRLHPAHHHAGETPALRHTPAFLLKLLEPAHDFDARAVVEHLVGLARDERASDMHLRPTEKAVEVLLRRDGVLQPAFDLPRDVHERLVVGLKNMARLASYKKSVPQDGRLAIDGMEVRVATTPTHFGEKIVMRFIRPERALLGLEDLGFLPGELARLQRIVDQPQGLVLATGPAGSGKTTTLFAAMKWRYDRYSKHLGVLNVVTLEDPIEVVVPEFTQTQVQPAMDMTFASGLRSILRQDPEVILVGEIRDAETAEAAVQCSLTGHLVLSTLHTRDSLGVIPRLSEMGIEAYLLSAGLSGVVYQRLLRRLCPDCRRPSEPPPELRTAGPCFEPAGCPACAQTGYRGRTAVAEVLEVDDAIRQGILDRLPLRTLREQAEAAGMVPLRQAALARVADGTTSYEEVCRVCPAA